MKNILVALVALVSLNASASQMPNPLLKKTYSSDTGVSPAMSKHSTCQLEYDGTVTKVASYGGNPPKRTPRSYANFTSELPDLAAIQTAINQAELGTMSAPHGTGPLSGPTITHSAIKTIGAGAPKMITLRSVKSMVITNQTKAAEALIRFLDLNCGN